LTRPREFERDRSRAFQGSGFFCAPPDCPRNRMRPSGNWGATPGGTFTAGLALERPMVVW
ncbi:MAG: hypothetical protein V3V75_09865, partial [Thermoguttaceae bacterium]